MPKQVKHTVSIDGNVIGTRRSPRTYTHAIVGHRNHANDVAAAHRSAEERTANSWAYYEREANPATNKYGNPEKAQAVLDSGREAYYESMLRQALAFLRDGEKTFVLQWSQSERNAQAKVNYFAAHGWHSVRVVLVERQS